MIDPKSYIEKHYGVSVDEFVVKYKEGLSRKELANYFGKTEFVIRTIAGLLGLRLKKRFRNQDYLSYVEKEEGKKEILSDILRENEVLSDSVYKLNKQLQYYKDQNLLLRKQIREKVRVENIYDAIVDELKQCVSNVELNVTEYDCVREFNNANGSSIICLSDLHIGAKVESKDVAEQNEYNFEIAKQRIDKLFNIFMSAPYASYKVKVVLLGDIFDGIIHGSDLVAEMPVMEAVSEFAKYMASKIQTLLVNGFIVEVYGVTGNHERMTDVQQFYKKGFDFTYIFFELLKVFLKEYKVEYFYSGHGLFEIVDDVYAFIFHGDIDRTYKAFNEQAQLKAIANCKNIYGVEPKLILNGHWHQYNKSMMYNGGYAISVGSLMGTNSYSYNTGYLNFIPSQTILFYDKDGELISEKVVLFKKGEQ